MRTIALNPRGRDICAIGHLSISPPIAPVTPAQKRGGGPTLAATRVGLTESVGPRQRFSNDLPSPVPPMCPPTYPRTSRGRRRAAAECGSLVFAGVFDATNGSPVQPAITILPAVPPSPPPLAEPSPTRSHPVPSRPFPSVDVI